MLPYKKQKSEILMDKFAEDLYNGRRFYNYLRCLADFFGLDKGSVDDVIQDFYIKASLGIKNFDSKRYNLEIDESIELFDNRLKNYLLACFINKIIDYKRKDARTKEIIIEGAEAEYSDSFSEYSQEEALSFAYRRFDYLRGKNRPKSPFEEAILNEEKEMLRNLISKLPSKKKRILLMYCSEGKAYKEIAKQLNIPIGTVKSRLNHARNRLQKLYRIMYGTKN